MKSKILFIAMLMLVTSLASVAQAKPSFGISCGDCHGTVSGKISVTGNDTTTNLGTQLDGQNRGTLKTFTVTAGSTATLSVNVLDGSPKYAIQVSRFETGGQQNSNGNKMTWNESNGWTKFGTSQPYFSKNDPGDGASRVYNFDLLVDAATPADIYNLDFFIGGKGGGLWYQQEHFYLKVEAAAPVAEITVTSPNGSETLTAGQSHTIQWNTTGTVNTVLLEYSTNSGTSWTQIAGNVTNNGSYNWTIPQTASTQTLIRVSGDGVSDVSNAAFTIIVIPTSVTISGTVQNAGGAAIAGVLVSTNNGGPTATTDASGNYSLTVPYNYSGTVTPTKTDYTFDPAAVTYTNLTLDLANENYAGSLPTGVTISGHITTADSSPVTGVLVTADNGGTSATTNSSGLYNLTVPYGWSGSITPAKASNIFDPATTSYTNVTADLTGENFTGSVIVPPVITGYITTADGTAIEGVLVTASNGGASGTTDAAGLYSLTVPYNFTGSVTPAKIDYTFEPVSSSYNNLIADVANADYTGAKAPYLLASHVFSAEIAQIFDHGDTALPDDLTHVFFFALETDATVTSVDIATPAGSNIQIPADAHTQNADVQTWHTVDTGSSHHVWEYEGSFASAAGLDTYGDGEYVVTLILDNAETAQTNIWFGVPNTVSVLAQPLQEPSPASPASNEETASPVNFTWQQATEVSVNAINLQIDSIQASQSVAITLTADEVAYGPMNLTEGNWQGNLAFENIHNAENADAIPVIVRKSSEAQWQFTVLPPAEQELIIDNGDTGTSSTGTWKDSGGADPYGSISVYSKTAGETYTFQTARSTYNAVYLWHTAWQSRSTAVSVQIYDGDTLLDTVTVNQQAGDSQWNLLGSYDFTSTAKVIVVASNGGTSTCADAVKFVPTAPPILNSVQIGGPATVSANGTASYTLTANFSDGSSQAVIAESWSVNNAAASISSAGVLLTGSLTAGTAATITASYSADGFTKTATCDFTISETPAAVEVIIDNGDAGTSSTGTWKTSGAPNPYGSNSLWSRGANDTYSYTAAATPSAEYEVYLWWTQWPSRVTNAPVQIYSGNTLLATVTVNQQANSAKWNLLGTFKFDSDAKITIVSNGSGSTSTDAVKLVPATSTTPPDPDPDPEPTEIIVDNIDTSTTQTGSWSISGGVSPYGENSLWSKDVNVAFNYNVNAVGTYDVYARWTNWPSRRTDVPYLIYDGTTLLKTVNVNQLINGGGWNLIASDVTFTQAAKITIISLGGGSTNADAVKLVPVADPIPDPDPDPEPDPDPDPEPDPISDTLTVTKAEYKVDDRELILHVQSTDQPNVELTLENYGQMQWHLDGDHYDYKTKPVADPGDTVTITSSNGGTITVQVEREGDDDDD